MKWQEFVRDYLSFTRKERIGILAISCFMLFIFTLPGIMQRITKKPNVQPDTSWLNTLKILEIKNNDIADIDAPKDEDENTNSYQYDKSKSSYSERTQGKSELFYFDPNTITETGWKKLGLRDKTINTIQNYKNKGGLFKKPEDLKRIYGLRTAEYEKLAPYIKIENTKPNNQVDFVSVKTQPENQNLKTPSIRFSMIEVNEADTTAFISLPGIGSKLATRIVNFRDKLGGFYSVDQVGETFGLPDSTFQKIKPYLKIDKTLIRKININKATADELKAHPYIKYSLANPIIAFRNEHGPFAKVDDIKQIMLITEEVFIKINPYLTTQ
jgi:competence protein ComEA